MSFTCKLGGGLISTSHADWQEGPQQEGLRDIWISVSRRRDARHQEGGGWTFGGRGIGRLGGVGGAGAASTDQHESR